MFEPYGKSNPIKRYLTLLAIIGLLIQRVSSFNTLAQIEDEDNNASESEESDSESEESDSE